MHWPFAKVKQVKSMLTQNKLSSSFLSSAEASIKVTVLHLTYAGMHPLSAPEQIHNVQISRTTNI